MKLAEYNKLVEELNTQNDIEKVATATGYDKDLLLVILLLKNII